MFSGVIAITNKGKILQAKVQAGATLHYTRIAIGDGSLTGQQPSDLNVLISEKKSLAITRLQTKPGGVALIGGFLTNQDILTGFFLREIGVFAQDPDVGEILYCYGNDGANAEYIAAGGGETIVERNIDILTLTGNAANVTATIDQSLVLVRQSDFDVHEHTGAAGDAPKLTSGSFAPGAVDDTAFGNRTVDDTATPNTGPNPPTNLFSYFGKMIRLITGEASWITAPAMTIKAIVTALGSLAALLTTAKTSLVDAINWLFNNTPKQSTQDMMYYVDPAGSDSNTGTAVGASGAFKTIMKAVSLRPQILNHEFRIILAVGTYAEDVVIEGMPSGKGYFTLQGGDGSTLSSNYTINSVKVRNCNGEVDLFSLNILQPAATTGLIVARSSYVSAYRCRINKGALYDLGSRGTIDSCELNNGSVGIGSNYTSSVASTNNTGTGNTYGLLAQVGGEISKNGTQPSGTTAEASSGGGVVR